MPTAENNFRECDSCAVKPGTPILCNGCIHNRALIGRLKLENTKGTVEANALFIQGRKQGAEDVFDTLRELVTSKQS